MKLSVLISTIDKGIENIQHILLPERKDVEYIISHQYTKKEFRSIPKQLIRDDVTVSQLPGKGLARSRNNALREAKGDIALLSDDDVSYKDEFFDKVINIYKRHEVGVACFQIETPPGERKYKTYPTQKMQIKDFSAYSPSSIELTFLIDEVRSKKIRFDERFGLGATFIGGEEKIFVKDCIDRGIKVIFFPINIVSHTYQSTNKNYPIYHEKVVKRDAAVDCRLYGTITLLKATFGPLKHLLALLRNKVNPFKYFYYRLSSSFYIILTNHRFKN